MHPLISRACGGSQVWVDPQRGDQARPRGDGGVRRLLRPGERRPLGLPAPPLRSRRRRHRDPRLHARREALSESSRLSHLPAGAPEAVVRAPEHAPGCPKLRPASASQPRGPAIRHLVSCVSSTRPLATGAVGRFAPRGALADELAFRRGLEDERASVGPRGVSRGSGPASSPASPAASRPQARHHVCVKGSGSASQAVRHRQCVKGSARRGATGRAPTLLSQADCALRGLPRVVVRVRAGGALRQDPNPNPNATTLTPALTLTLMLTLTLCS